jgi:hypothetical protein
MIKILSDRGNTYYLPLEPGPEDKTISNKQISSFSLPKNDSLFADFNFKKRVASYLAEYAKFLLSTYVHTEGLSHISDRDIIRFADKFLLLDTSFEYTTFPRQFGVENEGFVKNGKIIVNSEELRTRLVYYLRVERYRISSYWEKRLIPIQYNDTLDYSVSENEIILNGTDLFMKYIRDLDADHVLSQKVLPNFSKPYIFQNDNISDTTPYLAINVGSGEIAESVLYSWTQNKVVSQRAEVTTLPDATLYDYVNENKINMVRGQGDNKVLNYLNEKGEQDLTVLLRV